MIACEKKKKTKQFIEKCNCKHHSYCNEWMSRTYIYRFNGGFCLFIFLFPQQTTNEVSVWLIINLCSVLYSFVSMVFIYVLFVLHDTTLDRKDVFLIELVVGIINCEYFRTKHRPIRLKSLNCFVPIFQLSTFTCGIKCTYFRANSIWMDELHSKESYEVVPLPFKPGIFDRKICIRRQKWRPQFLCQTNYINALNEKNGPFRHQSTWLQFSLQWLHFSSIEAKRTPHTNIFHNRIIYFIHFFFCT